ncbi:MAG: Mrp/NBP35 family ATP-binding protein [Gammaproteobacteria bacterium AqS3]|nr:Mrp/NBP35 family ATP-binding protein [Gammaproteobacteria bacterium AqS3]
MTTLHPRGTPFAVETVKTADLNALVRASLSHLNPEIDWGGGLDFAQDDLKLNTDGALHIRLPVPVDAPALENEILRTCGAEFGAENPVKSLRITLATPHHLTAVAAEGLAGVRNLIAVGSGKGGVGKSAMAVALASSLQSLGARVGLLDADIYGPSLVRLLNLQEAPGIRDESRFVPASARGMPCMSMGQLAPAGRPLMWRGPMASGALKQMLERTLWGELDYLLVDMPPGTGDIQLTLAQQIPISGAVLVTTPADLALDDVRHAANMFLQLKVPLLGVVENMAGYTCAHCGATEHPFGSGGGASLAAELSAPLLGSVPLDAALQRALDSGGELLGADIPSAPQLRQIAVQTAWQLHLRPLPEAVELS